MPVLTAKRPFAADAVFIPDTARWKYSSGEHVTPDECTPLMVDGDNYDADVFTEEAWNNDGEPFCRREWGEFSEVDGGKVELLPELWIVKIDERDYWLDPDVLANCPRIYGVYVFDRKQHFHICSFEACHELHFLGTQYDEADDLLDDEYRRDEINSKVLDGDAQCELVSYWGKADIDRMLDTEIAEGCRTGKPSGFGGSPRSSVGHGGTATRLSGLGLYGPAGGRPKEERWREGQLVLSGVSPPVLRVQGRLTMRVSGPASILLGAGSGLAVLLGASQ